MSTSSDQTPSVAVNIHVLIQECTYGFPSLIRGYEKQIDDHVENCPACHERIIGFTMHLPRLRARMTVQLPAPKHDGERIDQLRQLKHGQCLPCGCTVTSTPWTEEEASTKFYKAFAEIMGTCEDEVRKIPKATKLENLPISTESLRRLRDKFWLPDGSSGSKEKRDVEEGNVVLQLPETIGGFILRLMNIHSGIGISQCSDCWCP